VTFDDLYELEAYGLIRSAEAIMYNYTTDETSLPDQIDYAGGNASLNFSGAQIHQLRLTRAGSELRQLLVPLSPVPAYTQVLREKFGARFVFNE
jgi:hypothetical protein